MGTVWFMFFITVLDFENTNGVLLTYTLCYLNLMFFVLFVFQNI